MNPNQNFIDYQQRSGMQQQQQPPNQYQFSGIPYTQQAAPPTGYQPFNQPNNSYYMQFHQDQSIYGQQQQLNTPYMMQMPQQPLHIMPRPIQPSAQSEHNYILEQVLQKHEEQKAKQTPKVSCPYHQFNRTKSCRVCKKIQAEEDQLNKSQPNSQVCTSSSIKLDTYSHQPFSSKLLLSNKQKPKIEDDYDGNLLEVLPVNEKGDTNLVNVWEQDSTVNLNSKLRTNILNCNYFRVDLFTLKTYHEVIDEIQKHVNHAEPWAVGSSDVPSTLFCCLYKYMLMKLTVKQVKGLVEFKQSPMVRAIGFLYVRFCCDPKYMFAWYKRHLLDDEEFKPGSDKNSPFVSIGDYVEKLLSDLEYYGTRLPRIPIKIETKIKAKLILNQEKRERKRSNFSNLGQFSKDSTVVAISGADGEWHEGILEKVEGKLIQVRFLPDGMIESFKVFIYFLIYLQAASKFEGGNELVNLGEIQLVSSEDASNFNNQEQKDGDERSSSSSRSSSVDRKRRSRSKSKGKKKRSRSREKRRHRSSSKSKSRDRKKKDNSKRSRSRSPKNARSKIESMKEREQKILEEIKKKQADSAVAFSKSDVARIPQSYKTALSGNPSRLAAAGRSSPTSGRREEFVETMIPSMAENRQKKQQEQEKTSTRHKTQDQIEKEIKMMQMYSADVQTKGSAITSNKQANDYA